MAPSVSENSIVACPNVDCRSYALQRAVCYPTVAAGVFLAGPLHCADCGMAMATVTDGSTAPPWPAAPAMTTQAAAGVTESAGWPT